MNPDTTYRVFIKHINVRWLSLQNAIDRILQMFVASSAYYRSENIAEARFVRLRKLYDDLMYEIQLTCLHHLQSFSPARWPTNVYSVQTNAMPFEEVAFSVCKTNCY